LKFWYGSNRSGFALTMSMSPGSFVRPVRRQLTGGVLDVEDDELGRHHRHEPDDVVTMPT